MDGWRGRERERERKGREGRRITVTECGKGKECFAQSYMLSHTHTHIIPTPLPTHSFTSCVTHLLRNFTGATPFTPDSSGFTPLHYAALYGHKMAVQMASHCTAATCDGYIVILPCFCYV